MMVDYNRPIEAHVGTERGIVARLVTGPDRDGHYRVDIGDGKSMYPRGLQWFDENGNAIGSGGWTICNVAEPAKPVRTAADMLERMEALTRRIATELMSPEIAIAEAKAIVAEMTPPVDPDLVEARKIAPDAEDVDIALAAIKRGRELERGK